MLEINQIYLGDCLELMKEIDDKSIDMILCDLPYGTTACAWDSIIPFVPLWEHYERIIKDNGAILLFGSEPFSSTLRLSNIKRYKYDWKWRKPRGSGYLNAKNKPMKDYEDIMVFSKATTANGSKNKMIYFPQMREGLPYQKYQKTDPRRGYVDAGNRKPFKDVLLKNDGFRYPVAIIEYSNNNHGSLHPTQKPVDLLEYLIKTYTLENELVLDNCSGSGSTAIAAINTNRNYICMEKDENYYKISQDRVKNYKIIQ